jgi:hypothetical protein
MKTIKIISIFIMMMFVAGCATLFPQGDYVTRDVSTRFRISVDSSPQGADVYLNDKLIGKTPLKHFPIRIRYQLSASGMIFINTGWSLDCARCLEYSISVKKLGYMPGGVKLQFKELGRTKLGIERNKYDFLLEKQEVGGSAVQSVPLLKEESPGDRFMGKTKEDVVKLLGEPSSAEGNSWQYIQSDLTRIYLFFGSDGRVNSYEAVRSTSRSTFRRDK